MVKVASEERSSEAILTCDSDIKLKKPKKRKKKGAKRVITLYITFSALYLFTSCASGGRPVQANVVSVGANPEAQIRADSYFTGCMGNLC